MEQVEEPENVLIQIGNVPAADSVARLAVLAQELQQLFDERSEDRARRHRGAGKLRH